MKRLLGSRHPVFGDHDTGAGHPERAARLEAIFSGLREAGLDKRIEWTEPEEAGEEALVRVHDEAHVRRILALRGKEAAIDADTVVSPKSVEAALRAAGAACEIGERVLRGDADYGFCFVRPPGHHAERRQSMGFCLFNNVAVAAADAIARLGAKRVLIFDPDVHHGNGTQEIFYTRSNVLFISIHQWPWYPGTGAIDETGVGEARGTTVNLPLPAGAGDGDYAYAAREVIVPALRKFRPDLVFFSAGFDAHVDDPLGGMRVTSRGFGKMYGVVLKAMQEQGVPGVFCLEGGYSLEALKTAVPFVVQTALQGGAPELGEAADYGGARKPSDATVRLVDRLQTVEGSILSDVE